MRRVLHILIRTDEALAGELAARQEGADKVEKVDLTAPEPDYKDLLERIFKAESVECW
jgi:hypothetical protein